MVEWHIVTSKQYLETDDAIKTDNKIYFLRDTNEIYRGTVPYTNSVIICDSFPTDDEPKAINKIYITKNAFECKIWDGLEWLNISSSAIYTPHISEDGILSWTNDKNLENPAPVNIQGPAGFSPKVDIKHSSDNAYITITITDIDGPHVFRIPNGSHGPPITAVLSYDNIDENIINAAYTFVGGYTDSTPESDTIAMTLENGLDHTNSIDMVDIVPMDKFKSITTLSGQLRYTDSVEFTSELSGIYPISYVTPISEVCKLPTSIIKLGTAIVYSDIISVSDKNPIISIVSGNVYPIMEFSGVIDIFQQLSINDAAPLISTIPIDLSPDLIELKGRINVPLVNLIDTESQVSVLNTIGV